MRTPSAAAFTAAAFLLGSLGLAGCSTGSNNATVTHTPALKTLGGRDTARSGVQAASMIVTTSNGLVLPGGPTPASVARRVLAMIAGGRTTLATGASTGACVSGVKQSAVTNADGSRTTTTDYYFDAACATLEAEEVITLTTPATPSNTAGTGTITSYDRAGAVHVVQKLTIAATNDSGVQSVTVTDTASATATGAASSAFGVTCNGSPPSVAVNCNMAHYGTSAGTVNAGSVTGEVVGNSVAAGTGGGNPTATFSIAFYAATALAISKDSVGNWLITGGSAFNTASGTYTFTTTGASGAGTMTFKDVLYTYTETATLAATGLSVTIVENPNGIVTVDTPIATATIDPNGTGVLSYADGTTEPISGFLIGY